MNTCIHRDVHNDNQIRTVQPLSPSTFFGIILRVDKKKYFLLFFAIVHFFTRLWIKVVVGYWRTRIEAIN